MEDQFIDQGFVVDEIQPLDRRTKAKCCERTSLKFLLHLLFTYRLLICVIVTSVFAFLDDIQQFAGVPFLLVLFGILSIKPTFGMSIGLSLFSLPLIIVILVVSSGIAAILPIYSADYNVLAALIIFIGIFAMHWVQYNPVIQKIGSAVFLGSILRKVIESEQFPIVSVGTNTAAALCLSCVAVVVAEILPPFSTKKLLDQQFKQTCASLAFLVRDLGNEFSHEEEKFTETKKKELHLKAMSSSSVPEHMKSDLNSMYVVVSSSRSTRHHNASQCELVHFHLAQAEEGVIEARSMISFLQIERPFGDLSNYSMLLGELQQIFLYIKAMRSALPFLDHKMDTLIGHVRREMRHPICSFCGAMSDVLVILSNLPRTENYENQVHLLKEERLRLSQIAEDVKEKLQAARKKYLDRDYHDLDNHLMESLPLNEISGTYFVLHNLWLTACIFAQDKFQDLCETKTFVPYSVVPFKQMLAWTILAWGPFGTEMRSLKNFDFSSYLRSKEIKTRFFAAVTVAAAVTTGSLFVLVPAIKSKFQNGAWAALTALFVYNASSGSTLVAAKDRMVGIFVGSSYSYVVLLILEAADPTRLNPYGITAFAAVYIVSVSILLQDNPAMTNAAIYAVVLLLYSFSEFVQQSVIFESFVMTFFGAVIVSLYASLWYFWNSSRYLFFNCFTECNCELRLIFGICLDRLTMFCKSVAEDRSQHSLGPRLTALKAKTSTMYGFLKDIGVEPTLWRAHLTPFLGEVIVKQVLEITDTLLVFDKITSEFFEDIEETKRSGLLCTNSIPVIVALRRQLEEAAEEILEMLKWIRKHPTQKLPFPWRPDAIASCQQRLHSTGIKAAILEGWSKTLPFDAVSARPMILYSCSLFLLDILASGVSRLWIQSYELVADSRRRSAHFLDTK